MEGPFVKFAHRHSFNSACRSLFLHTVFHAVPQLTARLEEATVLGEELYFREFMEYHQVIVHEVILTK